MSKFPKILTFDIETGGGPNNFKPDLSSIMSLSYKWSHEKKAKGVTVLDFGSLKGKKVSTWDKGILEHFSEVVKDADILVGHYSKRFDYKYISGRLALYGMHPLPPCRHIDTWEESVKAFNFSSNRAKHLAKLFGLLNQKLDNNWPEAWIEITRNPEKYVPPMLKYNKGDVIMTEELFFKILPFMRNTGWLHLDGEHVCPKCGSSHSQKRGQVISSAGRFTRYQCQDCGGWFKESAGKKLKVTNL